jgi:uncharacterized repeat protein (TIGR03803 family)
MTNCRDSRRIAGAFALFFGLAAATASAQPFTVLHAFTNVGVAPAQGLVRDEQGNLYGTTTALPAIPPAQPSSFGTVFKIDRNGQFSTLLTFTGPNGASPWGGRLLRDDEGNLYGLTSNGGVLPDGDPGHGTAYRLDSGGNLTILHVFGAAGDGSSPTGTLLRDRRGNFYGATLGGGATGWGAVFRIAPGGTETVLHSFDLAAGGWFPGGGLVADGAGNLYGVTFYGGPMPGVGTGEVYNIDNTGTYSVLHVLTGGSGGGAPTGELRMDHWGNLYGVTAGGGASGFGTVFELSQGGQETVLHSFAGSAQGDGADPTGTLIRDETGNFYGTTASGGSDPSSAGSGTVFKMDPSGNVTLLFSFPSVSDGTPHSPLARDERGNLYGTASGATFPPPNIFGVVFKLAP